jgi:hypothetical protein
MIKNGLIPIIIGYGSCFLFSHQLAIRRFYFITKSRRDEIWGKNDKSRFGYEIHFIEAYPFVRVQDLNG